MPVLHEYEWLVVVGSFGAFAFGFATGANDVANAFGTSVGSKALTLPQAVIIAAVFEFTGALVLGRVSTNVIAGSIADVDSFTQEPEVYAYGMCCALGVGAIWQIIASALELNVSATHSIIGAICGFSLVYDGVNGVNWADRDPGSFPPYKGMVSIILAWFIAPILTGAASCLFFVCLRFIVLRRANAYQLSYWVLPPIVLAVSWLNMYFVFTKGAKKYITSEDDSWDDTKSVWVSAVIAACLMVVAIVVCIPLLRYLVKKRIENEKTMADKAAAGDLEAHKDAKVIDGAEPAKLTFFQKATKAATHGLTVDIHKAVDDDAKTHEIHMAAEQFDPHVEFVFSYLQVFSAICVIFAHGAGEVGYMAGPLATIWQVYENGVLTKSVEPEIWIILIGAFGLVIGLATYGYNVTRAMGVKLAKLSPTRGLCAEIATAFVIMIAAQYGLPTSSSQCVTGAIVGVGLCEGAKGVNWTIFARQFAAWVSTLFIVGLCTAALFAQGVYSPSVLSGADQMNYENSIAEMTQGVYGNFNESLVAFQAQSQAGALPRLPFTTWQTLNTTINGDDEAAWLEVPPTITPEDMMAQLQGALALVQQYALNTLGQNTVFPGAAVCNAPGIVGQTAACPQLDLVSPTVA